MTGHVWHIAEPGAMEAVMNDYHPREIIEVAGMRTLCGIDGTMADTTHKDVLMPGVYCDVCMAGVRAAEVVSIMLRREDT